MKFHYNPNLPFILPQCKGNLTLNGRFVNSQHEEALDFDKYKQMLFYTNPQKKEKSKDTFKPTIIDNTDVFHQKHNTIVWLGHSSFYIRIDGTTFLTDPCLRSLPFFPRNVKLPYKLTEIQNVDYILISHAHRDHFDVPSLKKILKANPNAEFLAPLGLGKLIKTVGTTNFQEAAWYQSYKISNPNLKVHFLPAYHWHMRHPLDKNTMLWGSHFIASSSSRNIYFAGDTAYSSHFKEIGQIIPSIDICLMPIGAYKPTFLLKESHTSPQEAITGFHELGGKLFIPMHYGTYDLADEPLGDPIQTLKQQAHKLKGKLAELPVGGDYKF